MGTDKGTIKAYDKYARKWAKKLRGGDNTAHEYLEKPAMYKKLPNLKNKTVLCIGCGSGEECNFLVKCGAKKVVGIDISRGLIALARESYPKIDFHVMDMQRLKFSNASFDYVYSSLTLHYVKNWTRPLKEVRRVLKNKGIFLFSTHHPVKWGAEKKRRDNKKTFLLGYSINEQTKTETVHGDYLNERKIKDKWFNELDVAFYHKPFSSIFTDIRESGFTMSDFIEPKPIKPAKQKDRYFFETHQKIPLFMIFELKK